MRVYQNWVALRTMVHKEYARTKRVWMQALLPSVVTTILYFLIFGHVLGRAVGDMSGLSYSAYIAPGLMMLALVANAYSASVSALFLEKFVNSIEELLTSPMSHAMVILGYACCGLMRGIFTAVGVGLVIALFTHINLYSYALAFFMIVLTSVMFSLAGVVNALYAKNFDDIAIVPTFILTPLTFLGGVFYSLSNLDGWMHTLVMINPMYYLVELFRYAFFGIHYHYVFPYVIIAMLFFCFLLFAWAYYMLKYSYKTRR